MEDRQNLIYIHKDKKTNKYKRFEKVCMNKEEILKLIEKYNKNDEYDDYVELIQEPILYDIVKDYTSTKTYRSFINDVKDIINEIDRKIDELSYIRRELEEIIESERIKDET